MGGIAGGIGRVAMGAAVGGIAAIGVGLAAGAVAGMKFNSSIEQTTIAMGTMLGSTAKAKTLIGEVTKMASATPFEFPELADATKKLVAYGVAAEDAVPLMTRLGDVSSALALPIGEVADLYGKMKVSGRITMEDINQMAGRGIPIYGALAEVLGKGKDEIRGLVEEGKIGFPDVEKAFVSLTDKGSMFGGMMDKQSRSFAGLWSTIKDSVIQVFAMVVKPGFDWLVKEGLPKAIKLVGKFSEGFKKGGLEGGLKRIMDPKTAAQIVDTLGTVKDIVLGIGGAILAVSKVFISLPGSIKKVIIAVGLLAVAMKALNVPIKLPTGGGAPPVVTGGGKPGGVPGGGLVAGVAAVVGISLIADAYGKWRQAADEAAASSDAASTALAKNAKKLGPEFVANMQDAINRDKYKSPGVSGWAKSFVEGNFDTWIKPLWAGLQGHKVGEEQGKQAGKSFSKGFVVGIAELEARQDTLRAKLAERMKAGKLDNKDLLEKLDQTQGQIDLLRDTVHEKMYAGHLQNEPWNTSIGESQTRLEHFKSLVAAPMASGHVKADGWLSSIDQAILRMSTFRSMVQTPMASGHISSTRPTDHAAGGVFRTPHLALVAEAGPEAIIPLTRPARARQVMQEAGLVGAGGATPPGQIQSERTSIVIDARGAIFADDAARVISDLAEQGYDAAFRRNSRTRGLAIT